MTAVDYRPDNVYSYSLDKSPSEVHLYSEDPFGFVTPTDKSDFSHMYDRSTFVRFL